MSSCLWCSSRYVCLWCSGYFVCGSSSIISSPRPLISRFCDVYRALLDVGDISAQETCSRGACVASVDGDDAFFLLQILSINMRDPAKRAVAALRMRPGQESRSGSIISGRQRLSVLIVCDNAISDKRVVLYSSVLSRYFRCFVFPVSPPLARGV